MKELKINKHLLKLYDSIEELPIVRHHKFSKFMLIDANIGSDLNDFDAHLERVIQYIRKNDKDSAIKELDNLRQNVFFIQSEVSPKYLAFASLLYSVDGKEVEDLSDESLKKILSGIADVSVKAIDEVLEATKKKLEDELQLYFPQLFDSALVKEYYDKLKKRVIFLLDNIIEGSGNENEALEKITTELILFSEPLVFTGPNNVEIQHDKQFEDACLVLSQQMNVTPKTFTVLEYYNALFYLKNQAEKQGSRHLKR